MSRSDYYSNLSTPVLLMARPEYFSIGKPGPNGHSANDFSVKGYEVYSKNPKAFRKAAVRKWQDFANKLESRGATVLELDASPRHRDLVFTADPTLSMIQPDGRAVTLVSNFSNAKRRGEIDVNVDFFSKNLPDRPLLQSWYKMEGTGDNCYDSYRDVYWSGYTNTPGAEHAASGRSDIRAHKALAHATGVDVISLAVERPYFHVDTPLAPLPGGHIICYEGGLKPEAYQKVVDVGCRAYGLSPDEYIIKVTEEDARRYACNVRTVGNTVFIPECSEGLKSRIRDKGYEVEAVDLIEFIYAGGGPHCLTNNIAEQRIPGGLHTKRGLGKSGP